MSDFQDAISWLQNGEIKLLFFIVGYREDVKPIPKFEFTGANSARFYDYRSEGTLPVVLVEVRTGIECQNADEIVKEMFLRFEGRSEFFGIM
ncbi:MAG: hypothetical protein AAFR90_13890 [Pseudomonadota bacterium]